MSQEYKENLDFLIKTLKGYITKEQSNLHITKIQKEIDELTEKANYYRDAKNLTIPISELDERDLEVIPEEKRQLWLDCRTMAELSKIVSNPENILKMGSNKKDLKNIYYELLKKTEESISSLEASIVRYSSEKDIVDQLELIEKIIDKLEHNLEIDLDDFKIIKMVLDDIHLNSDITVENEYKISIFLTQYMLSDHKLIDLNNMPTDDYIEDIEENEKLLTDEELRQLFNYFGYQYDIVSNTYKDKLRRLGKIENIKDIFQVIQAHGIVISSEQEFMNKLSLIAVYSKPEIVETIIKNIKEDSKDGRKYDVNRIFNEYLYEYKIFISGTPREVRNGQPLQEPINYENDGGYYNKYTAIRLFFINHGVNPNDVIEKCTSIYGTKSRTLIDSYAKYKSYDLSDDLIFGGVSCLKTKDVYEKLDGLMELGLENYYKLFISRTAAITPEEFMKIYLSKKLGLEVLAKNQNGVYGIKKRVSNNSSTEIYDALAKIINAQNPGAPYVQITKDNVAKYMNIVSYFDTPELEAIKSGYDSKVEDAIYDKKSTIYNNPYIAYLDREYLDDGNKYVIDNVIISRRKVLRIMDALTQVYDYKNNRDLLMYALTYKSILNTEELTSISRVVNEVLKQGVELDGK